MIRPFQQVRDEMIEMPRFSGAMAPSNALGIALRRRRKQLKLSQIALGAAAGYDRNYIGLLEKEQQSPTFRTLRDLCKVLRLRPSRLLMQVEHATFEDWGDDGSALTVD